MSADPTPLWRCNACDEQFAEPEIWPDDQGAAAQSDAYPADFLDEIPNTEKLKVCPRCHSVAIERWK